MFCRQLIVFVWLPTFCDWWRRLRRTCGERNWRRSDSLEIGHPSCHPTSSGPTLRDCVDACGAKLTASGFLDAHARHFCHLTDRFRASRDVWERNRWQLDSLDTRRFYITHSSSANGARALRKCFWGAKLTSTGVLGSRALPVTRHWAPRDLSGVKLTSTGLFVGLRFFLSPNNHVRAMWKCLDGNRWQTGSLRAEWPSCHPASRVMTLRRCSGERNWRVIRRSRTTMRLLSTANIRNGSGFTSSHEMSESRATWRSKANIPPVYSVSAENFGKEMLEKARNW